MSKTKSVEIDLAKGVCHTSVPSGMAKEVFRNVLRTVTRANKDHQHATNVLNILSVSARQRFAAKWRQLQKDYAVKQRIVDDFVYLLAKGQGIEVRPTALRLNSLAAGGMVSELAQHHYTTQNYDAVFSELLHFSFHSLYDVELFQQIEELFDPEAAVSPPKVKRRPQKIWVAFSLLTTGSSAASAPLRDSCTLEEANRGVKQ